MNYSIPFGNLFCVSFMLSPGPPSVPPRLVPVVREWGLVLRGRGLALRRSSPRESITPPKRIITLWRTPAGRGGRSEFVMMS